MTDRKRQTHLEYYRERSIAPVRYDMSNMTAHLERRASLYNRLGIVPLALRGARVLEVAAGTGHNSLYLARMAPERLVLLEPNPTGVAHIREAYAGFAQPHTRPEIVTEKLEDYCPDDEFDLVVCENWLGTSQHELALLDKLGRFVAPHGLLVVTTVSPIGFVPNLLRRFFVPYLAPTMLGFEQRTKLLEAAYGAHLEKLGAMTRSATDWVHDNMLNPAYFGLCLSSPMVVARLGDRFDAMGTCPSFVEDWRWFKGRHGAERQTNAHFLEEYWRKCHNFLDSRRASFPREPVRNLLLEETALQLLKALEAHEDAHLHAQDPRPHAVQVGAVLARFSGLLPDECKDAAAGLNEVGACIDSASSMLPDQMAGMQYFSRLFGRETSYLSLQRNPH